MKASKGPRQADIDQMTFRTKHVIERVKISTRKLQYWRSTGFITPSRKTTSGHSLYTAYDICLLKITKILRDAQFTIQELRGIIEKLKRSLKKNEFKIKNTTLFIREGEMFITNGSNNFATEEWIEIKLIDLLKP